MAITRQKFATHRSTHNRQFRCTLQTHGPVASTPPSTANNHHCISHLVSTTSHGSTPHTPHRNPDPAPCHPQTFASEERKDDTDNMGFMTLFWVAVAGRQATPLSLCLLVSVSLCLCVWLVCLYVAISISVCLCMSVKSAQNQT